MFVKENPDRKKKKKEKKKMTIIHLVRTQNVLFRKSNISNPLIQTRIFTYQGVKNFGFSENFLYVRNEQCHVKFRFICGKWNMY